MQMTWLGGPQPVRPSPQPLSQRERGSCFSLSRWERVALSLSKGRVRGRTDRLGAYDTMRITRLEGEGWGEGANA